MVIKLQHAAIADPTMVRPLADGKVQHAKAFLLKTKGTYLRSVLSTLLTLRNGGRGDVQRLGPPDSRNVLVTSLLFHGPEESRATLPWGIFDETRWNGTNEVVVCV